MGFKELEFEVFARRILLRAGWLLVALLLLLTFYPHSSLWAGAALGLGVGWLSAFFLWLRLTRSVQIMAWGMDKARLFLNMGFLGRWGMLFAALLFAVHTGWFDLRAFLVGILFVPLLGVAEAIRVLRHSRVEAEV
ncbi:ATP synthase subunit I [Ammonifex thiophilus]|uniref:ATP synthase subunit I n=1 Tax=Ammonifex thiophilus TaxID=444093 RepID=A0A3D8P737_9THEO|nr:ATP synthase subunit I [Ammonifex thiophilus]RDV84517.1 hypothetical protein DXX99_00205 [Ammonifex thiophilus]